jgi:hypothetical protein
MTCDELTDQINTLTDQSNALLSDLASQAAQVNSDYSTAVTNDTYGGTYPATPVTTDGLTTRRNYLVSVFAAQAVIDAYNTAITDSQTRDGTQASLTTTNAALGSMKSQYIDQSCQPPLS